MFFCVASLAMWGIQSKAYFRHFHHKLPTKNILIFVSFHVDWYKLTSKPPEANSGTYANIYQGFILNMGLNHMQYIVFTSNQTKNMWFVPLNRNMNCAITYIYEICIRQIWCIKSIWNNVMYIIKTCFWTTEPRRDRQFGIFCCISNIAIRKIIHLHSICKTFSIYDTETKRSQQHNKSTSKEWTIINNWWLKPWPGTWREYIFDYRSWETRILPVCEQLYNRLWQWTGSHILQWQGRHTDWCIRCIFYWSWFDNNYT